MLSDLFKGSSNPPSLICFPIDSGTLKLTLQSLATALPGISIISGYYLIILYDFSTWDKFHYFWWHTGQYALIMGIFVFWVMTVAGKPENKSIKKNFIR